MPDSFSEAINELASMERSQLSECSNNVQNYIKQQINIDGNKEKYRLCFEKMI